MPTTPLRFNVARAPWEMALIHALNHETFAVEIPQHERRADGRLVDRFHDQNTYVICTQGRELAGMIAIRDRRPFSLDAKLPDLDAHLPGARRPCEIRLLAVARHHRRRRVLQGLFSALARHAEEKGYDLALISGRISQLKLYRSVGFVPFGPTVGPPEARYQPMYLSPSAFDEAKRRLRVLGGTGPAPRAAPEGAPVNLRPGPIAPTGAVRAALSAPPVSHRDPAFVAEVRRLRRRLCALAGARDVQLMTGSGTVANDAVAQQIALRPGAGLVLSGGEFGDRLARHGRAAGLRFEVVRQDPGRAVDTDALRRRLGDGPEVTWLWACHCETSTGVLNDLGALAALCGERGVALCVDAVSTLGCVPVDLDGVWLASATSGKGLGAPPGIAMVFHREAPVPSPERIPPYLDLGVYAASDGVPFTVASQLVRALAAALQGRDWGARFAGIRADGAALRAALERRGLMPLARAEEAMPAVVTLALPGEAPSARVGEALEAAGILIQYRSRYLVARNEVQVSLMGPDRPPPEEIAARIAEAVAGARDGGAGPAARVAVGGA